jgi:hypothetical protein
MDKSSPKANGVSRALEKERNSSQKKGDLQSNYLKKGLTEWPGLTIS